MLAGELIQQDWTGKRVIELEAAQRVSPNDLAQAFEVALKRPVKVEVVNRETWEDLFRSQGMKNPTPRIRMLDGFNESWIEFKDSGRLAKKGNTSLQQVVDALVAGDNTDDRA